MNFVEARPQSVEEQKRHLIYTEAYIRALKTCPMGENTTDEERALFIPKVVYYGVKMFETYPKLTNKEQAENCFKGISALQGCMSLLTLREFMNIFPIEKTYDGAKWQTKDYYSTIAAIKELGLELDEPIGDKILEFLLEYMNNDIMNFTRKGWLVMSAIRRFDGHLDLTEEFLAQQGTDTPNTFKNSKGDVLYVRHGKPVKLKVNRKQITSPLRLVK